MCLKKSHCFQNFEVGLFFLNGEQKNVRKGTNNSSEHMLLCGCYRDLFQMPIFSLSALIFLDTLSTFKSENFFLPLYSEWSSMIMTLSRKEPHSSNWVFVCHHLNSETDFRYAVLKVKRVNPINCIIFGFYISPEQIRVQLKLLPKIRHHANISNQNSHRV